LKKIQNIIEGVQKLKALRLQSDTNNDNSTGNYTLPKIDTSKLTKSNLGYSFLDNEEELFETYSALLD
jgi:hypothetical protein